MTELMKQQEEKRHVIGMGHRGVALETLDDLWRFSSIVAKTEFAPKGWTAEQCMIAIQFALEVGLTPMQGLQNVCVINGKPALYGDAPLALCRAHPAWDGKVFQEWQDGKDDGYAAHCSVGRLGEPPITVDFSVADAKKANLWAKQGPWQQYPRRMLQLRARSLALRDKYGDVLKGLVSEAEAQDMDGMPAAMPAYLAAPEPINVPVMPAPAQAPIPVKRGPGRPPKAVAVRVEAEIKPQEGAPNEAREPSRVQQGPDADRKGSPDSDPVARGRPREAGDEPADDLELPPAVDPSQATQSTREELFEQWAELRSQLTAPQLIEVRKLARVEFVNLRCSDEELLRANRAASELIAGRKE